MNKFYLWLSYLACLATTPVFAQVSETPIAILTDSVLVMQQGLNTLDIQLQNEGNETFEGHVDLQLPHGLRSIGEHNIAVQVHAAKSRYLSVKLQSSQLATLKDQAIHIVLRNKEGLVVRRQTVRLHVVENRSMVLMDNSDRQYLQETGDSVYVKLRVLNNGTTDEDVQLVLSSPDRLGQREFNAIQLSMPAGQDTLLRVGILVERYMLQLPQYTLRVSGLYANNDIFGNLTISFQNIASTRNFQQMYQADNLMYSYSRNFIDLQVDQSIGGTPMYVLHSEGAYRLGEGKFRYGLHLNQWGDILSRPNISNTFLQYEKDRNSLTLGNVQESLEAPFYGRGAIFERTDSLNDNSFSVGVIERSNDLLGYYGATNNPGMSAFAKLVLANEHPDRKRYEGQLYYDDNRMDSVHSLLWANTFDILDKSKAERIQLQGFIGAGTSTYKGDPAVQSTIQPSAAVGIKLMGNSKGNLSYSSDNFYSTPYYTGNRRGTIQLLQRVNFATNKAGYGAGLMYSRYNPAYFNPRFTAYGNTYARFDMSYYRTFSPFVSLQLQPSYNLEEASYLLVEGPSQLSAGSWQLMSSANIRSKSYKHSLYSSLEAGVIDIVEFDKPDFILRSNLTYNYERLGVSAMYQRGAFRVFEVLNDRLMGQSFGSRWMLSTTYQGNLFNGKLTWNGNLATYLSSSYGNTYSAGLTTNYRVYRNTLLTANVRYSHTTGLGDYRYDFTNIRLGVRQNLRSADLDRPTVKTGTLEVFCFYDNNYNDIFDEGDEIASDYHFMIGSVNFKTDRKGRAQFKKIPYGERPLFFPSFKGYQGRSRLVDIQSRSLTVAVPLQRVSAVRGTVVIRFDTKLAVDADLALNLYTVVARDQENNVFEARTDEEGNYLFSLPQGEYSLSLRSEGFPENIYTEEAARNITVEIGKNIEVEPFVLHVRNRTIEIKRFGN